MRLKIIALVLAVLAASAAEPARAQAPRAPAPQSILCGVTTLAVTTSSATVALPSTPATCPVVTLLNDGTAEVFVLLGNASAAATTSSVPLPAGSTLSLWVVSGLWNSSPATYVAAITASGSSTLRVLQANGP